MNLVETSIRKVRRVLNVSRLLHSIITASLSFFIFAVLFTFFSLNILYAFIPAGIYFIYLQSKKNKQLGFGDVEKKIPELEWRLRTSADNRYRHDTLASELHQDVMHKIKLVTVGKFLGSKKILYKLTAIIGLILVLGLFQTQDVTFKNTQKTITEGTISTLLDNEGILKDYEEDAQEAPEELFGEQTTPNYGDKEELLELNQMKGLVNTANEDPNGEGKTFTTQSTGVAGKAINTGTSQEKISEQDRTVVENYFKGINQKS